MVAPGDKVRKPTEEEILSRIPRRRAEALATGLREETIREYVDLITSWKKDEKIWKYKITSSVTLMALSGARLLGMMVLGIPNEDGTPADLWATCNCSDLTTGMPSVPSPGDTDGVIAYLRATIDRIQQLRANPGIWPTLDSVHCYTLKGALTLAQEVLGEGTDQGKAIKLWQTYRVDAARGRAY